MTLKNYCQDIIFQQPLLDENETKISNRILCPEFSLHVKDRKTYPLPPDEHLFILCWYFRPDKRFWGTLFPAGHPRAYSCSYQPHSRTQQHTHEYLELAYIVSGTFRQNICGKDIIFRQGDFCLIDKNCLHQDYLPASSAMILFFGIANEMFEDIMAGQMTTEHIVSFLKSALMQQKNLHQYLHLKPKSLDCIPEMEVYLKHLIAELIRHDSASPHIARGYLMRLFNQLSRHYDFTLSRALQKEMNWLLFEEISGYIQDNYRDISIQRLCEKFNFQEDYFNRLLKNKTGMTYTQYVQRLRITKAAELLVKTELRIEQITAMVGYQNKGYFYQIFSDCHGTTPAKYRRRFQRRSSLPGKEDSRT